MECRGCQFLSEPKTFGDSEFSSVRCTLGLWDKYVLDEKGGRQKERPIPQWYSYGESQLNRGPVRRYGEKCQRGQQKQGGNC